MDRKEMIKQKIKEAKEQEYNERLNILQEHLHVIKEYVKGDNKKYGYDRCGAVAEQRIFNFKIADTEKALKDKIEEISQELFDVMQREITDAEYEK